MHQQRQAGGPSLVLATLPAVQPEKPVLSKRERLFLTCMSAREFIGFGTALVSHCVLLSSAAIMVVRGHAGLMGAWGTYAVLMAGLIALQAFGLQKLRRQPVSFDPESRRVRAVVEKLCTKNKIPAPLTAERHGKDTNLGMLDHWFGRDLLIFNPAITEKFTDKELQGVVAHELSHSNKLTTKWARINIMMHKLSEAAAFGMGYSMAFAAVCAPGFLWHAAAAGAGIAGGFAGAVLSVMLLQMLAGYARRAHELKTDYRAIKLTGDRLSYENALVKLKAGHKTNPADWRRFFATHPSLDERIESLKKFFPD